MIKPIRKLRKIPESQWPKSYPDPRRVQVWLSKDYLVQVFNELYNGKPVTRLSVSSTTHNGSRWQDKIPWDDLYQIKNIVSGFAAFAIEIYPPAPDLVNVANMRHLWVLEKPLDIGWKKEQPDERGDEF
jgi:hypothetical protein